jgi:hypothetical protein
VKDLADWRQQFDKKPFTMMGLALGGGILLGTAVWGRRSRHCHRRRALEEFLKELVPAVREEFPKLRCG